MASSYSVVCGVFLVLLFAVFQANTQQPTVVREEIGNANEFVDREIRAFKESGLAQENFDPFYIPETFNFTGGYVHSMRIEGLSSLERNGDAQITPLGDDSFSLSGGLSVSDVKIFSQYHYRPLRFVRFNGHINGIVDRITAQVVLDVRNGTPSLEEFKIDRFGETKITKFSGTSFAFNRLGRTLINGIVNSNRDRIARSIESRARSFLQDLLKNVEIRP